MADNITKDDLKAVFLEMKREDMGHNNYYNVPPGEPVTKAINNPLVWISGYTVLLGFLGVLVFSIYSNDKEAQAGRISSNTEAVKEVQATQAQTNNLIIKMQSNQERIASQIEKNGLTLDEYRRNANIIASSRFTDSDGDSLSKALNDSLDDARTEFLREIGDIKNDIRNLENNIDELEMIKVDVMDNKNQLSRWGNFYESMGDRVRILENKIGVK